MKKTLLGSVLILTVLFLGACKDTTPDVSNIKVAINTYDFYKDFSQLDTANLSEGLEQLREKYPDYLQFYLDNIANGVVSLHDTVPNLEGIKVFLTHKDYRALLDSVNAAFPNTNALTEDITTTYKYIRYYDTTLVVPTHIYYAVSGLKSLGGLGEGNSLTICLDYLLGENFLPYRQINTPAYFIPRYKAAYVPVRAAEAIYLDKHPFTPIDKDLLTLMLERGKMQYFLSLVTPQAAPYMRLGFTEEQYKWCEAHEADIYNFFLANNDFLFNKSAHDIMRFVTDGPFTTGMPEESPGNIGSYTGLKIIQQYVKETGIDWYSLLQETDAQKILKLSKYRP